MHKELNYLILLVCTARVLSLDCHPGPCVQADCNPTRGVDCTAGVIKDVCGCCDVCAKDLGEVCGGPFDISGTCGDGLTCLKDVKNAPGGSDFNAKGKCIIGIEFTLDFARFILLDKHKGVTWEQARNLCTKYGYDLAQPQVDITRLASHLLSNPEFTDHQYYWLGGKGNGSSINWLSGEEVPPRSLLWRKAEQGFQSSTNFCMYLRDDGNPNPLGVFNCKDTTYMTPLCEGKPFPPGC